MGEGVRIWKDALLFVATTPLSEDLKMTDDAVSTEERTDMKTSVRSSAGTCLILYKLFRIPDSIFSSTLSHLDNYVKPRYPFLNLKNQEPNK